MRQKRIINAQVWLGSTWQSQDIGIQGDRLCAADQLDQSAPVIDAKNQKLIPAAIDGWCHLQRNQDWSRLLTESAIAQCVVAPSSSLGEQNISSKVQLHRVAYLSHDQADYQLANIKTLSDSGSVAFSQGKRGLPDTKSLLQALNYAASFDLLVVLRPADKALCQDALMHQGQYSVAMGLTGEPSCSEAIATAKIIELVKTTGCKVHLSRISTAEAVEAVRNAKAMGLAISADVAIANLRFTDADLYGFDSYFKTWPVLRDHHHQQALLQGLKEGVIDLVVSNHHPVQKTEKSQPIEAASWGMKTQSSFVADLWSICDQLNLDDTHRLMLIHGAAERIYQLPKTATDLSSGSAEICTLAPSGPVYFDVEN